MDGAAKKASQKTMREYFKLPMYESACFQKAFLHVQLLEPARQQGDPVFVEELNLLRCGRLPHRISRSAHLNPVEPDAVRLFSVRHAVKNYNDAKMMFLKGAPMTFKSDVSLHSVDSEENLHYSEILLLMFQKATKRKKKASATRQQKVTLKEVREFLSTSLGVSKGDMHKVSLYVLPTVHISFTAVPRVALRCSGRSPEDVNRLYHSLAGKVSQWIQQHGDLATVLTSGVVDLPDHAKLSVVRCDTVSPRDLVQKMKTPVQASFLKSMKKDFILQSKVLKVGCRVMLLRNLNAVLVNGSIGTVERFLPLSKCGPLLPDNVRATLSQPCARLYNRLHFGNNETEATHLDQPRVAEANLKGVHQTSALSYDPVLPIVVMDATGARVAIPWISLPLPSALYDGFLSDALTVSPLHQRTRSRCTRYKA
ncbi:hypothetical protein AGDE_09432 [Angomonas deanei]|nr:hypothetical protein AGDE_09432 [Angomonas deanei]|eukprot:EPY30461.1 hypothetical protein AGDE_09432 [Angomonas deanei]